MGPTAGVQHPHQPMILEASAVDVATDYPAKAIWRWAQAAPSRWLLPSPPLLHHHRGPGQAQASAPALQLNQGLITPVIQPSPVAGAVTQAIPTDDRQPLPVPALVNRGLATAESGCLLHGGVHHIQAHGCLGEMFMVSQHQNHLAGRRCGHKPKHQLHPTGAEHRTPLLPRGAVEDVPPSTSGSSGWAWNCWRRRRACPLGAQVNIPRK